MPRILIIINKGVQFNPNKDTSEFASSDKSGVY